MFTSVSLFLRHLHLPLLFSICPNSRHHQDSGVQCLPLLRHHSFILIDPMKFGVDQFSTQLKCTGEGIKNKDLTDKRWNTRCIYIHGCLDHKQQQQKITVATRGTPHSLREGKRVSVVLTYVGSGWAPAGRWHHSCFCPHATAPDSEWASLSYCGRHCGHATRSVDTLWVKVEMYKWARAWLSSS